MPMCRVRPPLSSPAPIEVIVRHVEIIEPDRELDARLRRFEEAAPMQYKGIWTDGPYERGAMVTHGGSMWHADAATSAKPGTPDSGWTLAVRRGRDGKDRREA